MSTYCSGNEDLAHSTVTSYVPHSSKDTNTKNKKHLHTDKDKFFILSKSVFEITFFYFESLN